MELVPYLSKRFEYFKSIKSETGMGHWELVTCSLFWCIISMFQKFKSGIRNMFPVPF